MAEWVFTGSRVAAEQANCLACDSKNGLVYVPLGTDKPRTDTR